MLAFLFFFFSSRRRHTRFDCDWSSDVCSSDLGDDQPSEPDTDGWSSPHTIVEIVNDDMPFLVDSVTAAVNDSGREVRLVIHPILNVVRDAKARVVALDAPQGGARESWMQVAITREPDAAERSQLAARLG